MLKTLSTRLRSFSLNPLSLSRTLTQPSSPLSTSAAGSGEGPPRLLVVQPRHRPELVLRAKLDEALSLANSLEEQRDGFFDTEMREKEVPPHIVVQNPAARTIRADYIYTFEGGFRHGDERERGSASFRRSEPADTFFGAGTVDTVKCHLHTKDEEDEIDAVFVNDILTGVQQRNLERLWGKPVLDRVGLIIEIFNAHAYTKEGKLQAELAALMYKRSRLVRLRGPSGRYTFGSSGEAQVVSARGRGSGGRGFISGAGETELQLQRRRIIERRKQLLSEIKEVRRTRALQRASRKRHGSEDGQAMPTVAVVGYTNAGKSTLVSALSNTDLYSDDRLFATVDPKLRSVILPSGRKALFSDTVGFISDLPVQLVEAFHATLEEVVEADLLVHVLDANAPNLDEHRDTVLHVLQQIGVPEEKLKNMIEVWNKIDLQDEMAADTYLDDGEVNDSTFEQSSEEVLDDFDDNNEDNVSDLSSRDEIETVEDEYSDNWILSEDEEEKTLNKMGWLTSSDQKTKSPEDLRKDEITPYSHSSPHVKTSALMGMGLHELLEFIDDRLKCENVVERNVLDRKWRPPRVEDADVAVGL